MPDLSVPESGAIVESPVPFRARRFGLAVVLLAWAGIPLLFAPPAWYPLAVVAGIAPVYLLNRRWIIRYGWPWSFPRNANGTVFALLFAGTVCLGIYAWIYRVIGTPVDLSYFFTGALPTAWLGTLTARYNPSLPLK